jgi:hypothetical protein
LYKLLREAAGKLGSTIEEPEWIELNREDNIEVFEDTLD